MAKKKLTKSEEETKRGAAGMAAATKGRARVIPSKKDKIKQRSTKRGKMDLQGDE